MSPGWYFLALGLGLIAFGWHLWRLNDRLRKFSALPDVVLIVGGLLALGSSLVLCLEAAVYGDPVPLLVGGGLGIVGGAIAADQYIRRS